MVRRRKARNSTKKHRDLVELSVDPMRLMADGPVIAATWSIPTALVQQLIVEKKEIPPPVRGCMLVDTGATRTCISEDVAKELGLKPRSFRKTRGVGGVHNNPAFFARIELAFKNTPIFMESEVIAVREMEGKIQGIPNDNDTPPRLIGLLGRDFLKHAKMSYDGTNGHVKIELIHSSLNKS